MVIVLAISAIPLFSPALATAQDNPLNNNISCENIGGLNCDNQNINDLIVRVIKIMLGIAFAIAVLFLIIGGFYYITARGNEEQAGTGKQTIINALIGIVVIIMSYVIVNVVANLAYNKDASGV